MENYGNYQTTYLIQNLDDVTRDITHINQYISNLHLDLDKVDNLDRTTKSLV
jgi:hypothetical protein